MTMKKLFALMVLATMCTIGICAQEKEKGERKFSPEKFDAELKDFITREARLSQQEAAKFFPVYKEMQSKQRTLYQRQKKLAEAKPEDGEACTKAIRERDETELEMKRIQQTYHEKFLELLPASKVYDIIKAEDRFHRRMIRNWGQNRQQPPAGKPRHHQK